MARRRSRSRRGRDSLAEAPALAARPKVRPRQPEPVAKVSASNFKESSASSDEPQTKARGHERVRVKRKRRRRKRREEEQSDRGDTVAMVVAAADELADEERKQTVSTESAPEDAKDAHGSSSEDRIAIAGKELNLRVAAEANALICEVYQQQNPAKLGEVSALLAKYAGAELALYERVCEKYGEKPKDIELIFQKAAQEVARQSPQKVREGPALAARAKGASKPQRAALEVPGVADGHSALETAPEEGLGEKASPMSRPRAKRKPRRSQGSEKSPSELRRVEPVAPVRVGTKAKAAPKRARVPDQDLQKGVADASDKASEKESEDEKEELSDEKENLNEDENEKEESENDKEDQKSEDEREAKSEDGKEDEKSEDEKADEEAKSEEEKEGEKSEDEREEEKSEEEKEAEKSEDEREEEKSEDEKEEEKSEEKEESEEERSEKRTKVKLVPALSQIKSLIRDVYKRRNPAKLEELEDLLEKYKGQEEELYHTICKKYGEKPKLRRSPEKLGYRSGRRRRHERDRRRRRRKSSERKAPEPKPVKAAAAVSKSAVRAKSVASPDDASRKGFAKKSSAPPPLAPPPGYFPVPGMAPPPGSWKPPPKKVVSSSCDESSELSESEQEALPLPPKAAAKAPPKQKCSISSSESSASAEIPKAPGVARLSPTISPERLRQVMAGKRNVDMAVLERYHQVFCT